MLKDILGQAWEAMVYNRRRTAITMIGMAWGIATVVLLLAYGAGFSAPSRPSLPVGHQHHRLLSRPHQRAGRRRQGRRARCASPGRRGPRIQQRSRHLSHLAHVFEGRSRAERSAHLHWSVNGVRPPIRTSGSWILDQGRFFNGAEDQQRAHVCVIGSENKTKLFSGGWALGETIRLNGEALPSSAS
jgi:putative ABC transport system permease protein